MTNIHGKHFILKYHTFDHDLYYEFIGDRLENCCANILKQGKHHRLMFLTKTVEWKRTFHVVQLMASDWWYASSIANIQVYTRCRKWVFAFPFACIYLLAFTCTNSWTEICKINLESKTLYRCWFCFITQIWYLYNTQNQLSPSFICYSSSLFL